MGPAGSNTIIDVAGHFRLFGDGPWVTGSGRDPGIGPSDNSRLHRRLPIR